VVKRINYVLILLVLAFLFANGCGGGNGTLVNQSPGVPPVVIGAITTNQTPHWYAGTAGTLSVTPSGGTTPYTYAWTFSGTANPSPTSSTAAAPSVTPAAVGTLTASLTVTDSTTPVAKTATASQDFTIETPPIPPITVGAITTSVVGTWNQGVAGTLSCTVSGGNGPGTYTYAWTFSGTANPDVASSTAASPTVTPQAAGTLHVTFHAQDSTNAAIFADATPVDFTIAAPPPPSDTLTIFTDKDTYAEGELVKITAHIQAIANAMGQFDACRVVFTAPATGHYLKFSTAPADAGYKFTLGPNDYSGTNDGIFDWITGNTRSGVVNPRTLSQLGVAFLTGSEEGIGTLNNQTVTPVGGPADVYDLRDITVIWEAGGATPYPEIPAGSSGDAFTFEQKVQTGASGHDIFIGFIGTDPTLSERTYYSNAADPLTKRKFAGGPGGAGLFGKTIHIS
jgi:hypothetical protein